MRIEFYGLTFETPQVTFHLWSPWRCTELEHRIFKGLRELPRIEGASRPDEAILAIRDPKTWRSAVQIVSRVLKGWQEEAEPGGDRRSWRWLLEADTDADGYDHAGEPLSLWGFLRIALERGGLDDPEKGEDIDLHGFGVKIWGDRNGGPGLG